MISVIQDMMTRRVGDISADGKSVCVSAAEMHLTRRAFNILCPELAEQVPQGEATVELPNGCIIHIWSD